MTGPRAVPLAAIEARLRAATLGPWHWSDGVGDTLATLRAANGTEICNFGDATQYYPTEGSEPNATNAALIAHAPQDVAALLDALRQTRTELQFALAATTVGPVKWLVPTKVGDDWMAWCVRAKQLLGGGGAVSGGPDA